MTEVERILERLDIVGTEQRQAQINWQRCDGALHVLKSMLADAQQREIAERAKIAEQVERN